MGDTITVKLIAPDGREVLVEEVPTELWNRFESRAKELKIPVDDLLETVLGEFLKSKGY